MCDRAMTTADTILKNSNKKKSQWVQEPQDERQTEGQTQGCGYVQRPDSLNSASSWVFLHLVDQRNQKIPSWVSFIYKSVPKDTLEQAGIY